jgi:hypothetical protein
MIFVAEISDIVDCSVWNRVVIIPVSEEECMATCPECDIEIEIDEDDLEEMEVGDPWVCDGCASNLRIASLDPLEFDPDDEDEEEDEDEESDELEADDADVEDDDADDSGDDWEE